MPQDVGLAVAIEIAGSDDVPVGISCSYAAGRRDAGAIHQPDYGIPVVRVRCIGAVVVLPQDVGLAVVIEITGGDRICNRGRRRRGRRRRGWRAYCRRTPAKRSHQRQIGRGHRVDLAGQAVVVEGVGTGIFEHAAGAGIRRPIGQVAGGNVRVVEAVEICDAIIDREIGRVASTGLANVRRGVPVKIDDPVFAAGAEVRIPPH